MIQNGPEFYSMWNKGISHFSLHSSTRFFAGTEQNGTKFKTLIILLLLYIFILFLFFWFCRFNFIIDQVIGCSAVCTQTFPPHSQIKNTLKEKNREQPQEKKKDKKTKERWALPNTNQITNHHQFQFSSFQCFLLSLGQISGSPKGRL